jgi:hypothetical protein
MYPYHTSMCVCNQAQKTYGMQADAYPNPTKKEELPVNFAHCVCKRRGSMSVIAMLRQLTLLRFK